MKITDVSVVVHERHLPTGMPLPPMEMAVLRIHTDAGVEGNTFISPPGPNVTDQILKQVKPMLVDQDPLDIGAIWHDLWAKRRGMHSTVQGYIDVAPWDIAGLPTRPRPTENKASPPTNFIPLPNAACCAASVVSPSVTTSRRATWSATASVASTG